MASPSQWTGVWASSRRWWWTGKPGLPQFMGSQRVGYKWALNWTELMKVIKDDINRWRDIPSSWVGRNQYCEIDYTTKHNLQIQRDVNQMTDGICHRTRTKNFTVQVETQKTPNTPSSLEKEDWSCRNHPSWLQIIPQRYSHQDSMMLAEKQ